MIRRFVAQNVVSMTARFAIEEGLVDPDDVYSEYEEILEEDIADYEELEEIFGPSIPDNVLQRWEQGQKRKETELEVLGNAAKRQRRQELIREKQLTEKAVDALRTVCNNGSMPMTVRRHMLLCLRDTALPFFKA